MKQYHTLVADTLKNGQYKENRTAVDTISKFCHKYKIDVSEGYPLLTTKSMDGFRWDSMLHELVWYISGEEHVRDLRKKTGIWDEWATEEGHLETAYGRFWRRFPIPENGQLPGESWPDLNGGDEFSKYITHENDDNRERFSTFDQLQYVIDNIRENPNSRRHVVSAWHPANAQTSLLPPCHYTFVFNVQGNTLNLHLQQRSGDIAVGIPFNIACYSLLLTIVAKLTNLKVGEFAHTITDAHIYCGTKERGRWYADNIDTLQDKIEKQQNTTDSGNGFTSIREWIETNAPEEDDGDTHKDHVPGLLTQLSRDPLNRPTINVDQLDSIDDLTYDDIKLSNYDSHPGIKFGIAE